MIVYRCEDSLESIFTAVYNAYEEHRDHRDTMLSLDREYYLFAEDVEVEADAEKTMKVIRTLRRRFGEEDYLSLCHALASPAPDKGQAVYRLIVKGLRAHFQPGHLFDQLADDDCNRVFALARGAVREKQHLFGFLRFQEVREGLLYAEIGPKNNLLTFLMPHFADRFPMENFVIHDSSRGIWGIHPAGKQWYLMTGREIDKSVEKWEISEKEQQIQALFCQFCRSIAIKERENKVLQRNMLPLRFREYMLEFREGNGAPG